jgi:transcription elongation factor/antiterminator RfaH
MSALSKSLAIAPSEIRRGSAFAIETNGRWYAVQCQPHRERGAAAHLQNQNFEVFLPSREVMRRHARKIETVRRPLFPGYLFLHLDLTRDPWRCINSTFGVVRIVMQNELPAAAPPGVVEALMDACDESGVLQWQPSLTLGQDVRVVMGPFADLVGQLDQLSDAGRVRVLLDIMGGRTPVFLPRNYVVSAKSSL